MTELYLYDAAYRPDLAAVVAHGGVAINGYLTGTYADSTTQPAEAHAAGLGYLPTYERGRDELVHATRAQGQAIGRTILAAFKAKGIPLNGTVAVYPSVDVNVPGAQADACNEGWRGIRDILEHLVSVRAYAEGAVIDALVAAGLVDGPCWLAAPTSWPGFNVNDKNVCVVQLVGSQVSSTDQDHIITDPHALGAWWPDGSPYAAAEGMDGMTLDDIWMHPIRSKTGEEHTAAGWMVHNAHMLAALKEELDAVKAELEALRQGEIKLNTTTMPVTGTVTIGG